MACSDPTHANDTAHPAGGVHGLAYDRAFLDALPVVCPRSEHSEPIRALSAAQFGDLHLRHLLAHPPDSVLFPFLHGLEGTNESQNMFFASTSTDEHGHLRIPNFRGLLWVAADELEADDGTSHPAWSDEDEEDDLLDDSSSDLDADADAFRQGDAMQDSFGMPMDVDPDAEAMMHQGQDINDMPHMHPVAQRMPFSPAASTTTVTASNVTAVGRTSTSSAPTDILDYACSGPQAAFSTPHDRRASNASSTTSSAISDAPSLFDTRPRSLTASTILSSTTSSPPSSPAGGPKSLYLGSDLKSPSPPQHPTRTRTVPLFTSTFRPHELLKAGPAGLEPIFVPPGVPKGISLRNFGIQVPIYATLSDIVVYSPRGDARAAVDLADTFRRAIENKAAERRHRRARVEGVTYNVFVLSASPEEIETQLPHLLKRVVSHEDPARAVPAATCPALVRSGTGSSLPDAMPGVEGLDDVARTIAPPRNGTLGLTTDANTSAGAQPRQRRPLLRGNTVNFAQREKDEMRELTRATEIFSLHPANAPEGAAALTSASTPATYWDPAVGQLFLGNLNDVPSYDAVPGSGGATAPKPSALDWHVRPGARSAELPHEPEEFDHGLNDPAHGFGFDVCVECHDMAPFPSNAHLRAAEEHVRLLDALWVEKCAGGAGGGGGARRVRPPPNAAAVIHLPFPSSPPNTTMTVSALMPFVAFLERLLAPIGAEPAPAVGAPPADRNRTRPLKVLIYSSDGYTESSVLALSVLMALRGLSLPESYLELQVEKRRSFFVYASDLAVLKRVETKVNKERGSIAVRRGSISAHDWAGGHGPSPPPPAVAGRTSPRVIGRPPSSSVSYLAGSSYAGAGTTGPGLLGARGGSAFQSQTLPVRRARACTTPLPSLFDDHQAWFSDPRFDGSFPSRVLPFLYLGNLNHASNAFMLHALGITHVVSVGECALVPPPGYGSGPQYVPGRGAGGHSSLWIEEREGRIKVLDIKGVCDDGIDTLEPQLAPVCEWIDRARAEGGNVLVHCRVGVSRSATITIAYVMQHLRVSLVDAYLIVRSRRLSVLIQPNMRLLYSLLGWEIKLARERAGGDPEALRTELARSLNWPYLAKEVHALNEKYLQ